jgi:regulator of sirC expression with transglutaminase-like and TPR domain
MNELLLSELSSDEKSLVDSLVLIEEYIFGRCLFNRQSINEIITYCQQALVDTDEPLEQIEQLINALFIEQLFIDNKRDHWPVDSHILATSIDYKIMSPILKGAVICHIFQCCGFDAQMIYVPEKTMIRTVCDDMYAIIFDPVTGESLNWHELDSRMDELDGDPLDKELIAESQSILVSKHITSLKNALIREGDFDHALKCVDILIALRPDDPLERRDRGFLLHQLDCFKVAYDDYQYFVDKCPKDPAAQLLKLQLDKITIADTVLH